MSAKLEKIGADLAKARAKSKEWDSRVKKLEAQYKEQENLEICSVTHSYNLTPDQLAKLLEIAKTMPPESIQAQAAMNESMNRNEEDEPNED
ncbi:MAG: DUF4315 family protein [Lachnospiraceae bacterium]|nr:DUF4315 family protein [Lachnospiraceae bacterium]